MIKIGLTGGGTAGHIIPALAIGRELAKRLDGEILFIGVSGEMEESLVQQYGYPFYGISAARLERRSMAKNAGVLFKVMKGVLQAFHAIRKNKIDLLIATGGFVSGPVVAGAWMARVPVYYHESNSYPGVTTKMVQKMVRKIYLGFVEGRKYLTEKNKLFFSGNPVINKEKMEMAKAKKHFGFSPEDFVLLITGGSQGALIINETLLKIIDKVTEMGIKVIFQCGKKHYDKIKEGMSNSSVKLYPFIKEMNIAQSAADLILCRAGAMTITEVKYFGIPALFIPLRLAAENHQLFNAKTLQSNGCAEIIEEKDLSPESLFGELERIYKDKELYSGMKNNLLKIHKVDTLSVIADDIIKDLKLKD